MSKYIKIVILGDYNYTYNSHYSMNLAIEHSEVYLEKNINFYWISIEEASLYCKKQFSNYDGVMIAPGPYKKSFLLLGIISFLVRLKIPVLCIDNSFKSFVEFILANLPIEIDKNNDKIISNNLIESSQFEKTILTPKSDFYKKIYKNHSNIEYSSSRYSINSKMIHLLEKKIIDVEAVNQYEEPLVLKLKGNYYFVATMFCPQINSTREMPHPIFIDYFRCFL